MCSVVLCSHKSVDGTVRGKKTMFEIIGSMFSSNDDENTDEGPTDTADGDPSANPEPGAPESDREALGGDEGSPVKVSAPEDDGPDVNELDVRLDELDDELSSTESSVRALQNSQEEMADSIDEMNDTVRQLVGVYDRLAAEENPFVDDPTEAAGGASPMAGVDGEEADAAVPDADPAPDEPARDDHAPAEESEAAADPVVSFDDLQEEPAADPFDAAAEFETGSAPDHQERRGGDDDAARDSQAADGGPVLESIPDGYAGEVLVMEWLATLMDRSGPAGAFRAVDYYENVGWISPKVEERLVDVIGGPALDVFVDPTQAREPTAEEHAVSHEYIRVLACLNDI
jgi:archaellum component FlaD/FlaE